MCNSPDKVAADQPLMAEELQRSCRREHANADPNIVGSYRLGETLGQGTFGVVKTASHLESGHKYAIKIMKKENCQPEEIRLQSKLNHDNIVKVHDFFELGDSVYVVMELVSGGDLFDHLVSQVRLKEDDARGFFKQIIDAVDYCHKSGIVHRDLKAENILLDAKKNVKIADFGFAAEMVPGDKLTKSCGSPNYAAPELFDKGCSYDGPEVDIWSCGVVLYALLTISLPFDAPDVHTLVQMIKKGKFFTPHFVSPDAKDLIKRMLTKDPAKRITMAEIRRHRWYLNGAVEESAAEAPTANESFAVASAARIEEIARAEPRPDVPIAEALDNEQRCKSVKSVPIELAHIAASTIFKIDSLALLGNDAQLSNSYDVLSINKIPELAGLIAEAFSQMVY